MTTTEQHGSMKRQRTIKDNVLRKSVIIPNRRTVWNLYLGQNKPPALSFYPSFLTMICTVWIYKYRNDRSSRIEPRDISMYKSKSYRVKVIFNFPFGGRILNNLLALAVMILYWGGGGCCWCWVCCDCSWWLWFILMVNWCCAWFNWLRWPWGLGDGGGWWLWWLWWCIWLWLGLCPWGDKWWGPQWGSRQCIAPTPTVTPTAPSLVTPYRETMTLRSTTRVRDSHPIYICIYFPQKDLILLLQIYSF